MGLMLPIVGTEVKVVVEVEVWKEISERAIAAMVTREVATRAQ